MQNRKDKTRLEEELYLINEWNLSVAEASTHSKFLDVLQRGDLKTLSQVEDLIDEDYQKLLDTIPYQDIEEYAEKELGLVQEDDCPDEKTIDEFDDHEIRTEFWLRDLQTIEDSGTNLKDDIDREELNKLFFSKTWAEREEILKLLRNETTN